MASRGERVAGSGRYFQRAGGLPMAVVAVSFGYLACAVFSPTTIPYESLGPLGHLTKYLVDNHHNLLHYGFWLAWGIHGAEALYSVKLCKTKGIIHGPTQLQWFFQTVVFGMASLYKLLEYKPPSKRQE
ncbi:transmembrane protein 254 [Alligator mississippiensis]|uniref:Transmembrane protein 254 n=2 Tax=Alligator mississippiensis TaxID=8496 RepID=A0A151MT28_ALLMI|nr:transmembrane protein 254 [Alligator mississippiensis]